MQRVTEASGTDEIGVGLDHRTSKTVLRFEQHTVIDMPETKKRTKHWSNRNWKPKDAHISQGLVRDGIRAKPAGEAEKWMCMEAVRKCEIIEGLLIETADLQRE